MEHVVDELRVFLSDLFAFLALICVVMGGALTIGIDR